MKKTVFIACLLTVFSQGAYSATQDLIVKKWSDTTPGLSNFEIKFSASELPSGNRWTTLKLDMSFSSANGDVDIALNGNVLNQMLKHYDINTDEWTKKTGTVAPYSTGDFIVSGHISRKGPFKGNAGGQITATAKYEAIPPMGPKNILFAHGMNVDSGEWDYFNKLAKKAGYTVYSKDVYKCGSIANRAKMLAYYIKDQKIKNNSLIAVAHSMGGLDLRYIVGKANEAQAEEPFVTAAKKIKRVFTIATPHGGVDYAALDPGFGYCMPAVADLKNEAMAGFNKRFTYEKFKNPATGKIIPFMAFHFQCPVCGGFNDCAVGTDGQTWKGAPTEAASRTGSHADNKVVFGNVVCKSELLQDDVFQAIIKLGR